MNDDAARQTGGAFLRGFFETIDAMLATGMQAVPEAPEALTEASLAEVLGTFPVAMHGMIGDGGRVGVLLSVREALGIQAQLLAEEVPEGGALTADDIPKLREVFEPCLGGGAGALSELTGRELRLTEVEVAQIDADGAAALLDALDNQAFAVPFTFEDSEQASGRGVMIGSQVLFAILPEADAGSGDAAQLSADEMNDILSGFDAGQLPAKDSAATADADIPPNLDLIMDIGLVCTARLGRVEMPIADILALGPGSILEVGHLVDEPIELLVNDKLIARGDVVVVDEKFGLRITEIVSQADRIKSLL
jgi:flagellar motor switch protein FliN